MAASVEIRRLTGSTPSETTITNSNTVASTSDDPNPGSNNPIPIPSSGTNRSFWVTTQLDCTSAPSGSLSNIRWYTDGSNNLGGGVSVNVGTASSYVQATGTTGDSGDELTTGNHSGLNASPVNAFNQTSSSPLSVSGSTSSTGNFGDRVVYQVNVGSSASPGETFKEQFTWVYDET